MSIRADYVRLETDQDKQYYQIPPMQAEGWPEQVTLFLDKLREGLGDAEYQRFAELIGGIPIPAEEAQRLMLELQ